MIRLDFLSDSCAVLATMNEAEAEALGWNLAGSHVEHDGDEYYAAIGSDWDPMRSDAENDAEAADARDAVIAEIEAADLQWTEAA